MACGSYRPLRRAESVKRCVSTTVVVSCPRDYADIERSPKTTFALLRVLSAVIANSYIEAALET